jgi:transposase
VRILGIDVGGGTYATAYFLESVPENPKEFVQGPDFSEFKIEYNRNDLDAALQSADLVVLEPTGGYESIVLHRAQVLGIEVKLANTKRLTAFRNDMGVPKTDRYDAFALAAFGHSKANDKTAFVRPIELIDLREMLQDRRSLTTQRRSLINRFRQRLHREVPEIQQFDQRRNWRHPSQGLFKYCAGKEGKRSAWWNEQISDTCGCGMTDFTRDIGKQIYQLDERTIDLERQIDLYLERPEFEIYQQAFDKFGFSQLLRAWWLCRIYPFEQFLDDDGKPITFTRRAKESGKVVTVHRSLSRFKCILGAGTVPNTSGIRGEALGRSGGRYARNRKGEKAYYVVGDRWCRQAFVLWASKQVVCGRMKAPYAEKMMTYYRSKKDSGKPYYKCLSNLHGYVARMLFRELCRLIKS